MLGKKYKIALVLLLCVATIFVGAENLGETKTILQGAKDIVTNILIPLAFTLALLFFFYGVAMYIWSAGSDKEGSKKIMTWGVVALFVMASVWGLVNFLGSAVGVNRDGAPQVGPLIPR